MTPATSEPTGELLMRSARAMRRRWTTVMAPWDLSPHQGRALQVISKSDGLRLSALAEALRIAPRSATEVVDGLESRGLVQRASDSQDRRAVCVQITEQGRRTRAEIDKARRADAEEFFGQLSASDRAALARILTILLPAD